MMYPHSIASSSTSRRNGVQNHSVVSPCLQDAYDTTNLAQGLPDKHYKGHVAAAASSVLTAQVRTTNKSVSSSPHAKRQVACASSLMASTPSPGAASLTTPALKGSLERLAGPTAVQVLSHTPNSPAMESASSGGLVYMTPSTTPASTVLSSQLHNTSSALSSTGDGASSLLSLTKSKQTVTPVKEYSDDVLATQAEYDVSQRGVELVHSQHSPDSIRRVGNKTCSRASMLESLAVPEPRAHSIPIATPQVGEKRSRTHLETVDVLETQPSEDTVGSPSIQDIMRHLPRVPSTGAEEYKSNDNDAQLLHETQMDDVNTSAVYGGETTEERPFEAPVPLDLHSIAFRAPTPFAYDGWRDWVQVLRSRWRGRDEIIDCLLPTTATLSSWAPNCVTYGAPSCGKSKFWREFLCASKVVYAAVDCGTVHSTRSFFASVLTSLANSLVRWVTEVRKLSLSKFLVDLHTGNAAGRALWCAIMQWSTGDTNGICRQACKLAQLESAGAHVLDSVTIGVKPLRCANIGDFTAVLECFCAISTTYVGIGSKHDTDDFSKFCGTIYL
jgi:hypothetical protein